MERCGLRPSTEKKVGGSEIQQPPLASKEKEGQEMKADFAEEFQGQTCGPKVALEELLRHLILVCWFQHHYQRLFFAYQGAAEAPVFPLSATYVSEYLQQRHPDP